MKPPSLCGSMVRNAARLIDLKTTKVTYHWLAFKSMHYFCNKLIYTRAAINLFFFEIVSNMSGKV